MMVFVNTDLDTNLNQNRGRDRKLPDDYIKDMWKAVQQNIGNLRSTFGKENFMVIDNSSDQRDTLNTRLETIESGVRNFLATPPHKPLATKWIESHK